MFIAVWQKPLESAASVPLVSSSFQYPTSRCGLHVQRRAAGHGVVVRRVGERDRVGVDAFEQVVGGA